MILESIGPAEWLIILLIILLLLGPKKLPELARALGRSYREFQKAKRGEEEIKESNKKLQG